MADTYMQNLVLLGWFGTQEILIVAGVFLLLFGGAKLPSLMRNMGRSINEFKAGMNDEPEGVEDKIAKEEREPELVDKN